MKRSQRFFVLLSVLKRIGLAVSFFWLVGCSPQAVYTTHLVSVSDSFEVDERLIGRWSDIFFDKDLHIEFDEKSNQLYAIWHENESPFFDAPIRLHRCTVEPIYTTRSDDQWFMNRDVHGAFYCVDPYQSPELEYEVKDFKELYKLVKYEIRATPVEDILATATLALQKLAQEDQESFMEFRQTTPCTFVSWTRRHWKRGSCPGVGSPSKLYYNY